MDTEMGTAIPRRQVLGMVGATAIASRVAAWSGSSAPGGLFVGRGRATAGSAELTLARFQPYVGDRFAVRVGRFRWLGLTLVEASASQPRPRDPTHVTGEAFSLVFATATAKKFDSGTLLIDHRVLGTFPLFLVAVGRGLQGQRYQAVVDRRGANG